MTISQLVKAFGIGLTGGIATGKSTVAKILTGHGYPVIDADELAREAVKPDTAALSALVSTFGPSILNADGSLDRVALRTLIFNDDQKRTLVESILHPAIQLLLAKRLQDMGLVSQPKFFFYEASLLFETGNAAKFKSIWATVCSPSTQKQRLITLRKLSPEVAERMIASQWPAAQKAALANVVIDTDCALPAVEVKVMTALQHLTRPPTT